MSMKRIIRGILPPAKKMAQRASGEGLDNVQGSSPAGSEMDLENEELSSTSIKEQHPKMDRGSPTSSVTHNESTVEKNEKPDNTLSGKLPGEPKLQGDAASSKRQKIISKNVNFVQLPTPVKSGNDKKEYKVIKLPNGLTALLISDVNNIIELEPEDYVLDNEIDHPEAAESESECASGDETDGGDDDESEASGPGTKSQSEEKLAAVALSVGVGSFSDPENIPGLAHFLEHMVFMGSEKYPQENDFDDYIKKQGGFDNACTYCEMTCFIFECHEKRLLHTMDRFTQFFISPLMKREAMTREREAIESEFQLTIASDEDRRSQLFSSMAVDKHPATKFPWGNLKTLRDNISDDKLYHAVHDFRRRHYSAHRMTLCVQARLPLETLEQWVGECFSAIPNNNLPAENFSAFKGPAFNPEKFCKFYTVNPVKDVCQVEISWFLPSLLHLYRKKPMEYISWFFDHEGQGSLLSHLRKKVWALDISSETPDYDFEHNSFYRLFCLTIILTKEGMKHLPEVVEAVFAYLQLLKNKGPQEWIFKEIQSIGEASFRFVDEMPADEYVESLAGNMHRYPPEDYITGDELYFEYDPDAIVSCLNEFRLDNLNIMVSTKTPPQGATFDRVEQWFGTQYHVQDIPQEWIGRWASVELYPDMALPEKNPFITTDFSILPEEEGTRDQPYPVKLVDNELIELWYRRDFKFLVPTSYLNVYLLSPIVPESAANSVMVDIFIAILKQQLMEDLYPARMADLQYEFAGKKHGWTIRCWGFNQNVPMLLATCIKGINLFNERLDEQMFAAIKDKLQKYYYNSLLKPEDVAADVRASLTQQSYWTTVDKYAAIKDVDTATLKNFISRFCEQLYVQFLAQGNILKSEAIQIGEDIVKTLNYKHLPKHLIPQDRVLQLPCGERVCQVQSFNKEDLNCVTTNYYQAGLGSIKELSVIDMLMMLMEEPLFNILRTREQLGYYVYCVARRTYGIIGFSVSVHSQIDKHTVEHVESRIEAFLETLSNDLKQMKPEDFNQILESLIKVKNRSDVHLQEEVDRNWNEIRSQGYMFDWRKKSIEALKDLKAPTVLKWLDDHSVYGNKLNVRKLSVQVVAADPKGKVEEDCAVLDVPKSENVVFKFLPKNSERPDYFIHDIEDFKKDLYVYPAHKIDS